MRHSNSCMIKHQPVFCYDIKPYFSQRLTFKEITATLTELENHQSHEISGGQIQLKGNLKGNKLCHVMPQFGY